MIAEINPIGVLGLGYLGTMLTTEYPNVTDSWGAWHKKYPKNLILPTFKFDWSKKTTWDRIPKTEVILVLTIPPLLDSPEDEAKRIHQWSKWMDKNRPELKRLIYVSTTGVYPKRNGFWRENSDFEPNTNSGKLRVTTEKILSEYFFLNVVRPGGIYGFGRGIDVRLKLGKPITVSNTPVHRIHVKDLVKIIIFLIKNPRSASFLNAIDLEAKPSYEVAQWLVENCKGFSKEMLTKTNVLNNENNDFPKRFISNQLLKELGITLMYPTFREGMGDI